MSYRAMSPIFGGVPAGTLNRIALSGGEWLPKGIAELMKLGVVAYRKPKRMTPKYMSNSEAAQSWTLWMRELVKSLRTPTPKELAKELKI